MITITQHAPVFTALYAAGKLKTDKYDKRDYVNFLYVKDGLAYRTDSKILIRFECDLENGWYQYNKANKTSVLLYKMDIDADAPGYENVLSLDGKYQAQIKLSGDHRAAAYHIYDLYGAMIQDKYIALASLAVEQCDAYGTDDISAVILVTPRIRIVLMPFRSADNE